MILEKDRSQGDLRMMSSGERAALQYCWLSSSSSKPFATHPCSVPSLPSQPSALQWPLAWECLKMS